MRVPTRQEQLWNTLTAGVLVLTFVMLVYYVLIGVQPASPLNPFAPPTMVRLAFVPTPPLVTPTCSPTVVETTWQPTVTVLPVVSEMPTWSATATPMVTPRSVTPVTMTPTRLTTVTPRPTPTVTPSPTRSPFTFTATINYQVHPVLTCDWSGVAGTAVDLQGRPARGYMVQVNGPGGFNWQVTVGSSPDYGPGGWEVRLGGRQVAGTWYVRLYVASDLKKPASETLEITLPGSCDRNLAFIRFQQNH